MQSFILLSRRSQLNSLAAVLVLCAIATPLRKCIPNIMLLWNSVFAMKALSAFSCIVTSTSRQGNAIWRTFFTLEKFSYLPQGKEIVLMLHSINWHLSQFVASNTKMIKNQVKFKNGFSRRESLNRTDRGSPVCTVIQSILKPVVY